jgi:hypothetical protein
MAEGVVLVMAWLLFFKFGISVCPTNGNPARWTGGQCTASSGVYSLTNNWIADITTTGNGGFLYPSGVRLELMRCVFENVQTGNDGGVVFASSLTTGSFIQLCCSSGCHAVHDSGFLYMISCPRVNLIDIQITTASAAYGAAICVFTGVGDFNCVRGNFTQNTCTGYGAVVEFGSGTSGGDFVISRDARMRVPVR